MGGSHAWGNPHRKVVRPPSFGATRVWRVCDWNPQKRMRKRIGFVAIFSEAMGWMNEGKQASVCGCAHPRPRMATMQLNSREQAGIWSYTLDSYNSTDRPYLMWLKKDEERRRRINTIELVNSKEVFFKSCPLFPAIWIHLVAHLDSATVIPTPGLLFIQSDPLWPLISRLFWEAHFIAPSSHYTRPYTIILSIMPPSSEPEPPSSSLISNVNYH